MNKIKNTLFNLEIVILITTTFFGCASTDAKEKPVEKKQEVQKVETTDKNEPKKMPLEDINKILARATWGTIINGINTDIYFEANGDGGTFTIREFKDTFPHYRGNYTLLDSSIILVFELSAYPPFDNYDWYTLPWITFPGTLEERTKTYNFAYSNTYGNLGTFAIDSAVFEVWGK